MAVLPTGDELVEPGRTPGPGQIRNSNAVMLRALASSAGAEAEALAIAPDERAQLRDALRRGLASDVLLVTGGVSAGNRDLVPETLEGLGVGRVFHKILLKPGKPLWFGVGPTRDGGDGGDAPGPLVFGLPGNPVSGIVGFLLFVRPTLQILAGHGEGNASAVEYPLAVSFRNRSDRPTYHPSRLETRDGRLMVSPLDWAGSADLKAVTRADGFAVFPAGDRTYPAGEIVGFVPLG